MGPMMTRERERREGERQENGTRDDERAKWDGRGERVGTER